MLKDTQNGCHSDSIWLAMSYIMNEAKFDRDVLVHARNMASSRRATRPCILNTSQADKLAQQMVNREFKQRTIEKASHDGRGMFKFTYTGGGKGATDMLNEVNLLGRIIGNSQLAMRRCMQALLSSSPSSSSSS